MPRTTIRSEDITDLQIKTADIADSAVTAAKSAVPAFDDSGLQDDIALLAFKTQANGSLARYNLVDQSVDAFEDATGVDASASTNELRNASNYYEGIGTTTPSVTSNHDSTGVDGDYTWYKWTTVTASGSYVSDTTQDHTYLVVGGGGSGGTQWSGNNNAPGGGGAGGMITNHGVGSAQSLTASTTYTIVVGAGGAAEPGTSGYHHGHVGVASSIAGSGLTTVTGDGGGYGATGSGSPTGGGDGGSGGGGGAGDPKGDATQGNIGAGTGYGYDGGAGGTPAHGGGGGGASQAGDAGGTNYGKGGDGLANSITGASVIYAAGAGGGGSAGSVPGGAGGSSGVGGTGGDRKVNNATAGDVNTGSGGGGGGSSDSTIAVPSGAGGTGIVILRRPTTAQSEGANMTLVSNAQTAQTQATKGDVVLTYTNGTGTTTLDTDLIASVSRDNGTTYTAVPLTLQGTTGGHNIATGHDVDISAQPAGTSMRWKVVTANQAVGKNN